MTKSIQIDLDDPKAGKIAEVLGNKTGKKILGVLAEKELSESEISKELGLPLNTVGYNIKKLSDVGLIEKSKNFHWSEKGKRVPYYKVANKKIVIMPKTKLKGIVPALIVSVIGAGLIKLLTLPKQVTQEASSFIADSGLEMAKVAEDTGYLYGDQVYGALASASSAWAWFFIGALLAIVVIVLWNWNKNLRRENEKE